MMNNNYNCIFEFQVTALSNNAPYFRKNEKYICRTGDFQGFTVYEDEEQLLPHSFFSRSEFEKFFKADLNFDIPLEFLSAHTKEDCYNEKVCEYTKEEVLGILEIEHPELDEEKASILAENVAKSYAFNGDYDSNLTYWDNIHILIDQYSQIDDIDLE